MKKVIVIVFALTVLILPGSMFAQDDTEIEYGQTIEGEITDREYEIGYVFTGSEGDIVLVEMRRANTDSELYSSNIILLDTEGDTLADADRFFSFEGADSIVVAELPSDGDYTILATRDDGRSGDDTGEFILRLINLEFLSTDTIEGQLDNESLDQYYAVAVDGPVTVSYAMTSGNYAPLMQISEVSEDGYPETVAQVAGTGLAQASLTVDSNADFLVVSIVADTFDYFFDEIEAEFEVSASGGK